MTDREQLRRHLELFRELGVVGVSRDAAWRVRDPADRVDGPSDHGRDRVSSVRDSAEHVGDPADRVGDHPADDGRHRADRAHHPAGPGRDPGHQVSDTAGRAPDPAEPGTGGDGAAAPLTAAAPVTADSAAGPAPSAETLEEIRDDLGDCTRCRLHGGRTKLVFGVGSPTADLVFVGEAPGRDEDRQGIPFVGRAGQLLTRIIAAIGLSREEVYIANVIKCRPPNNRNPEADEVATCERFLFRQLDVIRPRVVVALGGFAIRTLLHTDEAVSRLRGRVFDYRGAKLVPTFHPAFLLRSPERKRDVWEDMKRVRALLAERESAP